jgi:ribose 5-phosphate isomerase A
VAHLLPALADRGLSDLRCVATSPATAARARELGIPVEPFERLAHLDIAIDGTDQVDPDGWLVKGGGGAHTREKIVAAAATRFVVIADHTKVVDHLIAPVPLELLKFGLPATLAKVDPSTLRDVPNSPDGGLIADYQGAIDDPQELASRFDQIPGVVDHGLFPPALTSDILTARGNEVEHRAI